MASPTAGPPSPRNQGTNSASKKGNMFEVLALDPQSDKEVVNFFSYSLLLGTSTILQSRRVFPVNTYRRRTIGGSYKVMAINNETEIGSRMMRRIRSAVRMLHHKYLKEFIIVVSKEGDSPHDAVEIFTWRFAYNGGDISASFMSDESDPVEIAFKEGVPMPAQIKDLLLRLRQMCRQVMQPLPKDSYATFKLVYTDDAPNDYTAEGYQSAPVLYNLDPAAQSVVVGTLGNGDIKTAVAAKSVYIDDGYVATRLLNNLGGESDDSMLNVTLEGAESEAKEKKRQEPAGTVADALIEGTPVPTKRRREAEEPAVRPTRQSNREAARQSKSRTPGRVTAMPSQ